MATVSSSTSSSVSTSATPLQNIGGLASGLDTNSIIDSLLAIDRLPETKLQQQQTVENAAASELSSIKNQMISLQQAEWGLSDPGLWADTQSVSSTDSANLAVSRTGGAAAGGYQLQVTQLARADQMTQGTALQTADTDDVLHVAVGTGTPIDVAVSAGDSLATIAARITSDDDSQVYASVVNGKLVISGKLTGAANTISVTSDGDLASKLGMTESVGARDALYTLDGQQQPPSASNTVSSAMSGVTLNFLGVMAAPATVNIGAPAPNTDAISKAIQNFVSTYNTTIDMISTVVNQKRVASPQNDTDRVQGVLNGDSQLVALLGTLRNSISSVMSGIPGGASTLSAIGLSTGAAVGSGTISQDSLEGKLTLDTDKLSTALQTNFQGVKALFAQSGSQPGLAHRLDAIITPQVRFNGLFDSRLNGLASTVTDQNDQIKAIEQRVTLHEQQLRDQFTAMETAMSQSQSLQAQLASQIAQLG